MSDKARREPGLRFGVKFDRSADLLDLSLV